MPRDNERLQTVADAMLEASAELNPKLDFAPIGEQIVRLRRSLRLAVMSVQLLAEDLRERGDS